MTFKELQDDTLDRLQYDSSATTSGPRTRIKRLINQAHRTLLADPKFSKMRDSKFLFSTVASQAQYGLPSGVGKIKRIFDAATNNPRLIERSPDWLRYDSRADLNTGTPYCFIPYGLRPISKLPASTGSGIWVVSSSAADTSTALLARADALRSDGFQVQLGPVTLAGTARTQLGARTDIVDLTKLFLATQAQGDISIYDASSSGNLLGTIPVGQLQARYYLIQLYPVPSSVIAYTVECQLAIFDMAQDSDGPLMPDDFHHLLTLKAIRQELIDYKKQLEAAELMRVNDIEPLEAALLDYLINHDSYIVVPDDGRSAVRYGSNLGSWYPAGRW